MKTDNSGIMTVRELADYLRVHPTTIYRQLKLGQLPAFMGRQRMALQRRLRSIAGASNRTAPPRGRAPRSSFKVSELKLPEMHQEAEAMNQSFLRPFRHLS